MAPPESLMTIDKMTIMTISAPYFSLEIIWRFARKSLSLHLEYETGTIMMYEIITTAKQSQKAQKTLYKGFSRAIGGGKCQNLVSEKYNPNSESSSSEFIVFLLSSAVPGLPPWAAVFTSHAYSGA